MICNIHIKEIAKESNAKFHVISNRVYVCILTHFCRNFWSQKLRWRNFFNKYQF